MNDNLYQKIIDKFTDFKDSVLVNMAHRTQIDPFVYFFGVHNKFPCVIYYHNVDTSFIEKVLIKNKKWILLQDSFEHNEKDEKDDEGFEVFSDPPRKKWWMQWVHKDILLKLIGDEHEHDKGIMEIEAYYASPENFQDRKVYHQHLNELITPYIKSKVETPQIYLLTLDHYNELALKGFDMSLPDNLNIELNYGKPFRHIDKIIQEKLSNNQNGLYIFHGPPGTGKSTYIKYLSQYVKKKFIYIPEFMIPKLSDPLVLRAFMAYPDAIIILEDAEKLIESRKSGENNINIISLLLNITDGIMADILKMSVIVTHNTDMKTIDEALLRKGRLQYVYEFGMLQRSQIRTLIKALNLTKEFKFLSNEYFKNDTLQKKEMSLAEFFNICNDNGFITPKEVNRGTLGFGDE